MQQVRRLSAAHGPGRLGEKLSEALAFNQPHHDERILGLLSQVVDRHDVGVLELPGDTRLFDEFQNGALVLQKFRPERLDRHSAPENGIVSGLDTAHAAPCHLRGISKTPDDSAGLHRGVA